MDKPTVTIKTFGCQMNVYDSDRMMATLTSRGFEPEKDMRNADVILLNTCSIRDKAEHKVLSLLGELKELKDKNPKKVIGVTGCVGQRMGRNLLQRVPHLDMVMGPDSVGRVGELVEEVRSRGKRVLDVEFQDQKSRTYSQPAKVHQAKVAEYITIMKGCDHFCTYCIVPFVRGREKSRPIKEIIDDVKNLVQLGTKEVTFLGQNINTYGKGTEEDLPMLIRAANEIEGLERIRYITSHPRDLTDEMIAQFGEVEKLCPALHLPFQSGSDAILKKMSRLYTREEYLSKVAKLKTARPEIAMSADVIVGFPGETEEDFLQTLDIIREVRYSSLYMFKYSPRPGTRGYALGDTVPEPVKEDRLARAQRLAYDLMAEDNLKKVGTIEEVLIESMDKKERFFCGRNLQNKLIHVRNAGEACLGKIISVEITETNSTNLKGYYVDAPKIDRVYEIA
jgi:tRNA-2-methylthio-N6-dimethylallyladenosine synthase